jgi:two-component system, OmpR family, response regulator
MSPRRVLIVDDEENIRFVVSSALKRHGFEVRTADTATSAGEIRSAWLPDVVVLDVMLPDANGFDVLARWRSEGVEVPVVFLTARDSTGDRVRGLTDGGNDYVTKPFAVAELVARVKLRADDSRSNDRRLRLGDLTIDADAHLVHRSGAEVHVSPTEFRLLYTLMLNQGRVLSRLQLVDEVWGYDFDGDEQIVDTYIHYLRRKIDAVSPKLIHTIRGVGFSMRTDAMTSR